MVAALTPDQAAVGNEVAIAHHDARLAALEHLTSLHARQRNEKEWAPMAHLAMVMQQVRDLREPVQQAQAQLMAAHVRTEGMHADHAARLVRLEQQPEAATREDHDALFKEHLRVAEKEHMLLAQVIALRHEVGVLHKLAVGHDRLANRMEFAPMATVAHLLQRIMQLEQRLPPEETEQLP